MYVTPRRDVECTFCGGKAGLKMASLAFSLSSSCMFLRVNQSLGRTGASVILVTPRLLAAV
jgi:hypothetical protein